MLSFSSMELLVQHHLDDNAFSLSRTRNLMAFNRVHRAFVQKRQWAEHTIKNETITTVAGTEEYNWPLTQAFYEEPRINLLDSADSNRPWPLDPISDEVEWTRWWNTGTGWPSVYRRYSVSGVLKIALRWVPDTTGDTIQIYGRVEPRAFKATNYTTVGTDSNSAQAVVSVPDTSMLAVGDYVIIGEGTAREEIITILSIVANTSITGTTNLVYTHTSAQADRVERMTKFLQSQSDEALAMLYAAELKAKRGFGARAAELLQQANGLAPEMDTNPIAQSLTREPHGI